MKLWGGRFTKATEASVDEFTASIEFDQKLADVDIEGSLAHVSMLGDCGLLSSAEVDTISQGLKTLLVSQTYNTILIFHPTKSI